MYVNREDEIKFNVSAVTKMGYFRDFDLETESNFWHGNFS